MKFIGNQYLRDHVILVHSILEFTLYKNNNFILQNCNHIEPPIFESAIFS